MSDPTNPKLTDDDHGNIFVTLDGRNLRSWIYVGDDARRLKMKLAHEYIEGWCDGREFSYASRMADRRGVRYLLP